ncbi:MAG TPA: hypothetical protein VLX12_09350 [Syntrophorhabdales bacterium]|nr:hypothetical protein [Syntrophorhabdales bacterium]
MAEEQRIGEELKKMEYEPLLPVEKKLIAYSLILGVVLLGVLILVSSAFFPAAH